MPRELAICGECGTPRSTAPAAADDDVPQAAGGEEDSPVDGLDLVDGREDVALGDPLSLFTAGSEEDVVDPVEDLPAEFDLPAGAVSDERGVIPPVAPTSPKPLPPRRRLPRPVFVTMIAIVTVSCVVAVGSVAVAGVGWGIAASDGNASSATTPALPAAPRQPVAITLPGFETDPAWSASDVTAAAVLGDRVITLTEGRATAQDVTTGKTSDDVVEVPGGATGLLEGFVGAERAVTAVSATHALIWVEGQDAPPSLLQFSPGRGLVERTGTLFTAGQDFSFALVTIANGEVPITAPRPSMIVLGAAGDSVIWASAAGEVLVAAANGTTLSTVKLALPDPGAVITPETGWVRAATSTVTVVGWTLPDGQTLTGVHSTTTGQLLHTIPGAGAGLLSPDRDVWVTNGHQVNLVAGTVTPLPAGFVPARYLGADLYGALSTGSNALLSADASEAVAVEASTVTPHAIADGMLLTLTDGRLSAYPAE
jgi:hypothetical protein